MSLPQHVFMRLLLSGMFCMNESSRPTRVLAFSLLPHTNFASYVLRVVCCVLSLCVCYPTSVDMFADNVAPSAGTREAFRLKYIKWVWSSHVLYCFFFIVLLLDPEHTSFDKSCLL